MRWMPRLLIALIAVMMTNLAACRGLDTTCGVNSVPVQSVAAPAAAPCGCAQAQAAPMTLVAPSGQLVMASPTAVRFSVGAPEYVRSAFSIPGNLITCGAVTLAKVGAALGEGLSCAGAALAPTPTPTATFVYAPAVDPSAAVQAAPCAPQVQIAPQAAPCAPAPQSAPPAGYWTWHPGVGMRVEAAPQSGPALPIAPACEGECCTVPLASTGVSGR